MIVKLLLRLRKLNVIRLIFSPLLFSLVSFSLILWFSPKFFNKYKVEIVNIQNLNLNRIYYDDLDTDGISEKIELMIDAHINNCYLIYHNLAGKIINQWNLRGQWLTNKRLSFGDFNNNGFKEVYCLTIDSDSIFLHIDEPMLKNGFQRKNIFVDHAHRYNQTYYGYNDILGKILDTNQDQYGEFVFAIYGAMSKKPRAIYKYDIINNCIYKSPISAAGINIKVQFQDLNKDGVEEVTGVVGAPENIHDNTPYTDSAAWLMVMNLKDSISFYFPPIKFNGGLGSSEMPTFISCQDKGYIASTQRSYSATKNINATKLRIYKHNGALLSYDSIMNKQNDRVLFIDPLPNDNIIYLGSDRGVVWSTDLELKQYSKVSELDNMRLSLLNYHCKDLDFDGLEEILFLGHKDGNVYLVIYQNDFTNPTIVKLPEVKSINLWHTCSIIESNLKRNLTQINSYSYEIKYYKSSLHFYKYPIYLGVFLILYLIFWGLQKAQNYLAEQRLAVKQKLLSQQLALSKRQVEPHFMLNVLNNIGHMFLTNKKDDAQYYFGKFTSLIHHSLEYADQVESSLQNELNFISDYLLLQKKRLNDELEFSIEVEDDIEFEQVKLPHSLIFTFVENAVKHGLMPKEKDRKLKVCVREVQNRIQIIIEDNGIGRDKSMELKTHGTQKGMKIAENIITAYNRLYTRMISYSITDIENDMGTIVLIQL